VNADASLVGFLQELGWTAVIVGGPMLVAALWTLWTERGDD
jgi:hypothetical protein